MIRRMVLLAAAVPFLMLCLTGCGGGSGQPKLKDGGDTRLTPVKPAGGGGAQPKPGST
jgi:hypothetical protein